MASPIATARELLSSRRGPWVVAGVLAVAMLAAGMGSLAASTDVERVVTLGSDEPAQAEQDAEPAEQATPEEQAWALLPQDAQAAADAYGATERSLISVMSANVWTATKAGLSLTFSEDGRTFTENDGGEATVTAFAIVAAMAAETSESGGVVTSEQHFTVRTASGTYMATLSTQSYSDGSASVTTLASGAFGSSTSWTLAQRAESVEVVGPGESWYSSNRTTPEALVAAFDEFVGTAWPTVSKATWDGTVSYDYNDGVSVARLPFTLDDSSRTRVIATLDLSTGEFSVSRRSS